MISSHGLENNHLSILNSTLTILRVNYSVVCIIYLFLVVIIIIVSLPRLSFSKYIFKHTYQELYKCV